MTAREFSAVSFPGTAPRFPLEITGTITRPGSHPGIALLPSGETWRPCPSPGRLPVPAALTGSGKRPALEFFLAPGLPPLLGIQPVPRRPLECLPLPGLSPGDGTRGRLHLAPLLGPARAGPLAFNHGDRPGQNYPGASGPGRGSSAVITDRHLETTYWSLTHPGLQPDFHRRDAFLIDL